MSDEKVQHLVEQAVFQQFEQWAKQHPSLASVIDGIALGDQAVQSLRNTEGYRQAVAGYHQARNEQDLFGQLLTLAEAALSAILK